MGAQQRQTFLLDGSKSLRPFVSIILHGGQYPHHALTGRFGAPMCRMIHDFHEFLHESTAAVIVAMDIAFTDTVAVGIGVRRSTGHTMIFE